MATALLTRYSYPKVPGDQPESIIDVTGPNPYTAFVNGSPGPPLVLPTGGQRITAEDFAMKGLDFVAAMPSPDGRYQVRVVPEMVSPPPNPQPTQLPDGEFVAVRLVWLDSAGAQASGNLSTASVRLFARGRW